MIHFVEAAHKTCTCLFADDIVVAIQCKPCST